jgi:hypothetical protein
MTPSRLFSTVALCAAFGGCAEQRALPEDQAPVPAPSRTPALCDRSPTSIKFFHSNTEREWDRETLPVTLMIGELISADSRPRGEMYSFSEPHIPPSIKGDVAAVFRGAVYDINCSGRSETIVAGHFFTMHQITEENRGTGEWADGRKTNAKPGDTIIQGPDVVLPAGLKTCVITAHKPYEL